MPSIPGVAMMNGQNSVGDSVERLMADLRPAEPGAAGALNEASQLLAQALQTGLGFRRAVPFTSSLVAGAAPSWANGLQPSGSLGPFKDLANRDVWIDLFPIVEQVSLVRVAGGVPFMKLPIEIFIHLPGPPSPTVTYEVPAGSVWFPSQLLDATAPAGSWTGIQVSGGTVSFSDAVTGTGNEIVVPSGVTVDLEVNTASQPPGTGTAPARTPATRLSTCPPASAYLSAPPPSSPLIRPRSPGCRPSDSAPTSPRPPVQSATTLRLTCLRSRSPRRPRRSPSARSRPPPSPWPAPRPSPPPTGRCRS